MLQSSNAELFRKNASVQSSHKVFAEWNYNDFIEIEDFGCYQSTYNSTYSIGQGYDYGTSNIFFEGDTKQFSITASSGATSITLPSSHGVIAGMRVEAVCLPADTYVSTVNNNTITLNNPLSKAASSTEFSFYSYYVEPNKARLRYSPLVSIFDRNRPDPGIINLTANTTNPNAIIDIEKITVSSFGDFDYVNNLRADRIYPIYKNSTYKYWNSIRKLKISNVPQTVGVANNSGVISYAAPFAVYDQSFYTNKIVVKTQKYAGYPVSFKIELLEHNSTTWTEAYSATNNTSIFSDGKLEIYYNGTSWTTTPQYINSFIKSGQSVTGTKRIYGIRFSVTKMSNPYIPLEIIELSPRLSADITDYVMAFGKNTTLSNTNNAVTTAGLVSTTGSMTISNVDRIFSQYNSLSVLSGLLYKGTKFMFYQVVDSEYIPINTLYALDWSEKSDFTTTIELEDYLFYLKGMKAPEIVIANLSGVEASVAILMLLDNAGVTNYKFNKLDISSNKDDFVFDFFYSNKSSTVAEILETIATSAQYAIYVDANNVINATTKEKFFSIVDADNTNFWLIGSENWTGKEEEGYLNTLGIPDYVSNIMSISEDNTMPVTEATVRYTGNGIIKDTKSLLRLKAGLNPEQEENLLFNASLVTRDLSLGIVELWNVENTSGSEQTQTLLSMAYISDILGSDSFTQYDGIPEILYDAKTVPITGSSENDVIRKVYNSATDTEKKYFRILLDPEFATAFLTSGKTTGYVLIDSELIKYKGLILDVFDDKNPANSGRSIIFNSNEYGELKSQISSGSSILCKGLLVDLNFEVQDLDNALESGEKEYLYVSNGRGFKNTLVRSHYGQTTTDFIDNYFVTKLYGTSFNPGIKPTGTMVAESIQLNDPKLFETEKAVSYPGYLKYSGPKSVGSKNSEPNIGTDIKLQIPIDNHGERFVTGFFKELPWKPQRISTRMRLLEKPKTQLISGGSVINDTVNRGIAGIAFRVVKESNGTTGYFVEIEEVGNIQEDQIENKEFANLRLYKIIKNNNNKYVPRLLGEAFVNVSAVGYETLDVGQANINNTYSYTGISDLSVTVEQNGTSSFTYRVFWEDNEVIKAKESWSDAINKKIRTIGVFGRSDTEALFEHVLASSNHLNGNYPVSVIFGKNSPYMSITSAAERGLIPSGIPEMAVGENSPLFYYEDFGRKIREVAQFTVNFQTPAVYAYLISLKELNPDYYVANFSSSSYGADFWVFNTSRASINLGGSSNMPLIISGVALSQINSGEISMSEYINNRLGDQNDRKFLFERNRLKYGINNVSISSEYLNSRKQAEELLQWIIENNSKEKKILNAEIFPNPLLEIGDKVRVFYPEMQYDFASQKDKVYYIHSISYSVDTTGPKMNISVREI